MNLLSLMPLELAVTLLGLVVLLIDLWLPPQRRRELGIAATLMLVGIFAFSFMLEPGVAKYGFGDTYVSDDLSLFFKRFFLLAGILVMVMVLEFSDRVESGLTEYFALILFALTGMMFSASANHFATLFVSLELITVTFYVLTSFSRKNYASLEAGFKYLIFGALSSAVMVYGMALIYGVSGTMDFAVLAQKVTTVGSLPLFKVGMFLVIGGLSFKLAAFPFHFWAPDVYQGAPSPTTAFLAVGSKAAGVVLLLRFLFTAVPSVAHQWAPILMIISALTILYGNLCAIPQQNLKRLLGYSSIAQAGYILLGVAALSSAGSAAVLFYIGGYLFTVLAAFTVITVVLRKLDAEEISNLAGLGQRSPFLAAAMTLSVVSLAGVPPLAGFFGKFLLLRSILQEGAYHSAAYVLVAVALVGVVISFYYYFGVVRAIYWGQRTKDLSPFDIALPTRLTLLLCMAGMILIGIFPAPLLQAAEQAVRVLKF